MPCVFMCVKRSITQMFRNLPRFFQNPKVTIIIRSRGTRTTTCKNKENVDVNRRKTNIR